GDRLLLRRQSPSQRPDTEPGEASRQSRIRVAAGVALPNELDRTRDRYAVPPHHLGARNEISGPEPCQTAYDICDNVPTRASVEVALDLKRDERNRTVERLRQNIHCMKIAHRGERIHHLPMEWHVVLAIEIARETCLEKLQPLHRIDRVD